MPPRLSPNAFLPSSNKRPLWCMELPGGLDAFIKSSIPLVACPSSDSENIRDNVRIGWLLTPRDELAIFMRDWRRKMIRVEVWSTDKEGCSRILREVYPLRIDPTRKSILHMSEEEYGWVLWMEMKKYCNDEEEAKGGREDDVSKGEQKEDEAVESKTEVRETEMGTGPVKESNADQPRSTLEDVMNEILESGCDEQSLDQRQRRQDTGNSEGRVKEKSQRRMLCTACLDAGYSVKAAPGGWQERNM